MATRPWVVSPVYKAGIDVIRAVRVERGLSLRDVGVALKKPHTWMHKVEVMERRLDFIEFIDLAHALGMTPEELLGRVRAAIPAKLEI